jgi:hypothetical protein
VRNLVRLLLDRGGDLDLTGPRPDWYSLVIPSACESAQRGPNVHFLNAVAEWEAEQLGRTERKAQ